MWYIWYKGFMNGTMNGFSCGYHQIHSNSWEGQTLPSQLQVRQRLTADLERWDNAPRLLVTGGTGGFQKIVGGPAHVLLFFDCFWYLLMVSAYFCILCSYRNSETPTTHAQWNFCSAWHAARCCGGSHRYVCWCFLWSALSSVCDWSIAFEQSNHALALFSFMLYRSISRSIAPHCCIQCSSEIGCNIFYYMTLPSFSCLLHFAEVGNSEGQSKNISELAPPCRNHVQHCQVQLQVWPAWPAWCLVVWRKFLPDAEWSAFLSQNDSLYSLKKCLSPIWTEILLALVLGRKTMM